MYFALRIEWSVTARPSYRKFYTLIPSKLLQNSKEGVAVSGSECCLNTKKNKWMENLAI